MDEASAPRRARRSNTAALTPCSCTDARSCSAVPPQHPACAAAARASGRAALGGEAGVGRRGAARRTEHAGGAARSFAAPAELLGRQAGPRA
eukprot:174014-Chlamydomonas_euryale.AAC.1